MTETLKFDNDTIEAGREEVDNQPDTQDVVSDLHEVIVINPQRHRFIIDGLKHSRDHGYDVDKHLADIYSVERPSA